MSNNQKLSSSNLSKVSGGVSAASNDRLIYLGHFHNNPCCHGQIITDWMWNDTVCKKCGEAHEDLSGFKYYKLEKEEHHERYHLTYQDGTVEIRDTMPH